jgi:hypothetical protein
MKPKLASTKSGESGLMDLFAILLAVGIVAALGFAYINNRGTGHTKVKRIVCVNNLKIIGVSSLLWASDHGDKMPAQLSTNAGGTMEMVAGGVVLPSFLAMSNELRSARTLTCPADAGRRAATNFGTLANTNISYFMAPEANETRPYLWLSGDRNLATNNAPLQPGLFTMPTNRVFGWTAAMHAHQGNLAFADCSVRLQSDAMLRESATNALRAWLATTNAPLRLVIP